MANVETRRRAEEAIVEIVAECKKCGREFVTEPKQYPAYDPFYRRDLYDQSRTLEPCGGEIVRKPSEN